MSSIPQSPSTPAASVQTASPRSTLPQLGIHGYHVAGSGEYVLDVDRGSEAARVGLKRGDLILALNGRRLADRDDWDGMIGPAAAGDGAVSLLIHDAETGEIRCPRVSVFLPPWMA
jgi:S1-C subfamily serine protease